MSAALATAREQTARIARLNDLARRAMGVACTAVATVGFRSLSEADQSQVRELVETYDAFTEDSDPHGERDFGTIYQLGDGRWTTERPRACETRLRNPEAPVAGERSTHGFIQVW